MFKIKFHECAIRLFGGHSVELTGCIAIKPGGIATIIGNTGSGKTTVLASIAQFLGCPAFRGVDIDDGSKIELTNPVDKQHVAIIRQNPSSNFLGDCVGHEIGLSKGISRLSQDDFRSELEKLWLNHFDGNIDIFERKPEHLSSGQQQTLALLAQVLRKPDFLLADEPLARLSIKNAQLVLAVLNGLSPSTHILMSTHEDSLFMVESKRFEDAMHHEILRSSDVLNITLQNKFHKSEIPRILRKDIGDSLISWTAYREELQSSDKFSNMPEQTIKNIIGSGDLLTKNPLNIDVFMGRSKKPTVSVRNLRLAQGINIVYGENGAGKTLVGRVLGGDLKINPNFKLLSGRYATVSECKLNPIVAGNGIGADSTLLDLHKNHYTHFLSSNPEEIIASTGSIEQEIGAIYKSDEDSKKRIEVLQDLGLIVSRSIESLSFGEKKLVSFVLLQSNYSLVVLDEIFANLSDKFQNAVATQIIKKCSTKDWNVVVLTSNRPLTTIDILRRNIVKEDE